MKPHRYQGKQQVRPAHRKQERHVTELFKNFNSINIRTHVRVGTNYRITHRLTGKWTQGEKINFTKSKKKSGCCSQPTWSHSGLLPQSSFTIRTLVFVNAAPGLYLSQLTIGTTLCLRFRCGGSSQGVLDFPNPLPPRLPPLIPPGLYFRQGIMQNVMRSMPWMSCNLNPSLHQANRDFLSTWRCIGSTCRAFRCSFL